MTFSGSGRHSQKNLSKNVQWPRATRITIVHHVHGWVQPIVEKKTIRIVSKTSAQKTLHCIRLVIHDVIIGKWPSSRNAPSLADRHQIRQEALFVKESPNNNRRVICISIVQRSTASGRSIRSREAPHLAPRGAPVR